MSNPDLVVIGGGYWGKNLIRDFHKLNALYGICDSNQETLQNYKMEYPNVKLFDKYSDILSNDEVKKLVIALPAEMHYKFAKEALMNNKDVYVEKPLTLDIKEAEELIELADKKNKILMVGHLLHYHPAVEKILEIVNQGMIGQIRYINSNRLNLGKFRQEENVLWSFAPHDISVILALMQNKLPEYVINHGHSFLTSKVHDITNTMMEFKDGTYCQINVNWLNPFKEQKMVIVGTKGMIIFDDCQEKEKIRYFSEYYSWKNGKPLPNKTNGMVYPYSNTSDSPLLRECMHFLKCCLERSVPKTDGKEGLRVLKVLDASQKSLLDNGNKVFVEELFSKNDDESVKSKGQEDYFQHPTSEVNAAALVGKGCKIWHFSHLMKCEIGKDCNIGQNVFIGNNVKLGSGCKVQNNVSIYDGVVAGDYVFFGPSCVLTNDLTPRAKYPKGGKYISTIIEDEVSIGANATIVCGVKLGKGCMVGAGAVVTKDVAPYTVVIGNPAREYKRLSPEGELLK